MDIILIVVSTFASIIGSICGIGGGIIIKPILDSLHYFDIRVVVLYSGCTVLVMALYNVSASLITKKISFSKISFILASGAVVGGFFGKYLYSLLFLVFDDKNNVVVIQSFLIILITLATILFTLFKNKVKTYNIVNIYFVLFIGFVLGSLSAFLSIGGGPINIIFLIFFFSMDLKKAVQNSLYIILFSQASSLSQLVLANSVPEFNVFSLLLMICGGIIGAIIGRKINAKLSIKRVEIFFMAVMVFLVFLNIYNFLVYL